MNRCAAFVFALCCACLSVSSACFAQPADWLRFSLEAGRETNQIRADFRGQVGGRDDNNWSSTFRASDFAGLDLAGFRASGSRPLRFALTREAGRLDCVGHGGESYAAGGCAMTSDPGFLGLLAERGIGRPSREQAFGLIALDVRRDLIDAVAAAHYPTPTIDNLIEMTAVGVNARYIADLSRLGYRPKAVQNLVEFRALGITPEWIGAFARIGYANVPADDLVQLKALNVTPEYVMGFERVGYRNMRVDDLVQLKALNITPDFARWAAGQRGPLPPVNDLVEMKVFDRRR
jgi:hypothetical protein